MTLPSTLQQSNRITTEMRDKFIIDRSEAAHFCPTSGPHFCSMKISEDVRQYAAAQGIAEEEALAKGMEDKSKEFAEAGAELYQKA